MIARKVFLYTLFSIVSLGLFSQNHSQNRIPCEKSVYLINYFYIKKYKYAYPIQNDPAELIKFTRGLNNLFADACIEFKICNIDTIHDYNYYLVKDDLNTIETDDIVSLYYNNYAINIYWVGDVQYQTYFGICENLREKPRIFIPYNTATDIAISSFNIQMLRYFGLKSTASLPSSVEFVNTSNGKLTADSLWDTPADPSAIINITDKVYLPPTQTYLYGIPYYYTDKKDPNGDLYNPMIYNMMCDVYVGEKCKKLTKEQYQQLIINERKCRRKRWDF